MELELAVADRKRLQQDREVAIGQQNQSKQEIVSAIERSESASRITALLEVEHACNLRETIETHLVTAESEIIRQREEFLLRRTGRQQVEKLLEDAIRKSEIEAGRKAQQMLDDWYGQRIRALRTDASRKRTADADRSVLKKAVES